MDRQNWLSKWKASKKFSPASLATWGAVLIFMGGFFGAYKAGFINTGPKHEQEKVAAKDVAQAPAKPKSLWETYTSAYYSAQEKAAEIQHALEENERLRYENTNLRLKLETLQFDFREKASAATTDKIATKLDNEDGSRVARTLASIGYKPPTELLPNQLFTLGLTYFKAHEDEKAAVIFSFLTNMEENTAFQNARNYVLAGVAWYRIQNYTMADFFFDKALKEQESEDNLMYQAQARLWKGVIAKHGGKDVESQYWLKDLIDHHPQSMEAEWVNSNESKPETKRLPAAAHESESHAD